MEPRTGLDRATPSSQNCLPIRDKRKWRRPTKTVCAKGGIRAVDAATPTAQMDIQLLSLRLPGCSQVLG